MNGYVTGGTIKALREKLGYTQRELGELVSVSDKTVSKWETGRGLPDVSLLDPLGKALRVSLAELLSGEPAVNRNRSGNMLRSKFYVCPLCGNIIAAAGEGSFSCCGIALPPLEAEPHGEGHDISAQPVEDELFVSLDHPMTKEHYISFIACVTDQRIQVVKLYPEQSCETRLKPGGGGLIYAMCNRHGLFVKKI